MKIVVFGGSGFLGSHTADCLTSEGHEVVVADLLPSEYLQPEQVMAVGDFLDLDFVVETVSGCDAAYSFAGIADIQEARRDPHSTLMTNTSGNLNILEACRREGVDRYLFASTLYVYSQAGSFYRTSKQCCELAVEAYAEEGGPAFTILRYGTLYGPRSGSGNTMHRFLTQALNDGKIVREGDGEEVREYIHVADAARLGVRALDEDFENQHVIISGSQPIRIKDLLTMIQEILNGDVTVEYTPSRLKEHYRITPYNFKPNVALKMQSSHHIDLGQGVLELLAELHEGAPLSAPQNDTRETSPTDD